MGHHNMVERNDSSQEQSDAAARFIRRPSLPRILASQSVKVRVTLLALVIGLVSTILSGLYVSYLLRVDVEKVLAAQQFAAARSVAESIDRQLKDRLLALEDVASLTALSDIRDPGKLQQTLQNLPVFQALFNGGTFITDIDGVTLASTPIEVPRYGVSYAEREWFIQAIATGQPAIGAPSIGKVMGIPGVVMAAPMRDASGRITGVVAGLINLRDASFLDDVQSNPFGTTGDYLLVAPDHRMVITSSDRNRIMERLGPAGVNPQIDRFVQGYEGTAVLRNPKGVEVLSSVKRIPTANWYVAVTLPTREAFAPVKKLELRLFISTGIMSLLAGACVWWALRRQLMPLQTAAQALSEITSRDIAKTPLKPLPVGRGDEIGQLLQSFNRLLSTLNQQRDELTQSELLYSSAFRTSPDAFSITGMEDGRFITVNDSFTRMFGWSPQDLLGRSAADTGIWRYPGDREAMLQVLRGHGRIEGLEAEFVARDGRLVSVQLSSSVLELKGRTCMLTVVHDITARKQAERQIETLAFYDTLTGLPNRRLFLDRLSQALPDVARLGRCGALLELDLDDFKSLNDNHGHVIGDTLLRTVAARLTACVQAGTTVARVGSDEFVVLLTDLSTDPLQAQDRALQLAQRLQEALGGDMALGALNYHCTASVGMVLLTPQDDDPSEVLKRADLALEHAKSEGRGQVRLFAARMLTELTWRASLEVALREAIEGEQLQLYLQPQVDAQGHLRGAEALLRWHRPEQGWISPGEFIPVAEHSGLIVPLGQWVLRAACRSLADWSRDPALAHLTLAVNVSSRQFRQDDFVRSVLQTLDDTGADANRLVLELTESLLVDHIDGVASRMTTLGARGVSFALDDFGTGFSSLAYLQRLPLDELKIDQGFVRDIEVNANDLAIVSTIVALGQGLGLRVVAEGVETPAQRDALIRAGCHHFQGYLFGRPMPAEDMQALARQHIAPHEAPQAQG